MQRMRQTASRSSMISSRTHFTTLCHRTTRSPITRSIRSSTKARMVRSKSSLKKMPHLTKVSCRKTSLKIWRRSWRMSPETQTTIDFVISTPHPNSCQGCLSIWHTLSTSQFFMRMLWWGLQRIKPRITKLQGSLIQAFWLRLRLLWPGAGRKTSTTRLSRLICATWWV